MRCTKCGTESTTNRKFCAACGSPLPSRCPKCGAQNAPSSAFCEDCGAALPGHAAYAPTSSPQAASGAPNIRVTSEQQRSFGDDRRRAKDGDLDPEEARAIVDPVLHLMIAAVHRYGGYVAQSIGDGIFALFGAPVAHEDYPQRALYSAMRMQEEIRRYADRLRAEGRTPLQIRIGANTGEVVVRSIRTGEGKSELSPVGHTTNLAARMQALANPGSTVIAETTRKLVEGYFQLKSLGPTKVRGVSETVNVYEVTGLGPLRTRLQRAASRGYTKFVGREREMQALKQSAEQAKSGHGQIVAAVAEPGVGKSRLFYEFKAKNQSGWLVLEALSVSHGKVTAYLPLTELLHDYFKIAPDDDPRTRREKIAGKVTLLDRSLEESLQYLFALLGVAEGDDPFAQMNTPARRRRTQEPIKRLLLRESLNQPLMLVFEDLHWIDEETQAFLNLLAEGIANAPVLLLVNYRPEYSHRWGGKTYYTQLRLDSLGKESANEMLSALVGDAPELTPLKRLVLQRTEGNPLFMEELVQALFDEGALVRNGSVKVTRSLSQLKIPPTVQGILASRIDRLPPEAKELLQTLAVIGTEFPLALVHQVVQLSPERLDRILSDLQRGEFIYEQPAESDVEYTFKHALTHDVSYNSLLSDRRKLLHERTAQAMEALYRERLEDHYPDLAHHYRSSANAAKAVEYLCLAGEQAARRSAYSQALANVEPALELLKSLPEGPERLKAELGVRLMQGMVVLVLYGLGSQERLQAFQRVCELAERLGENSALLRGLLNVAGARYGCGEISLGLEMTKRCVELAERSPNPGALLSARIFLSLGARLSGDLLQAAALLDQLMKSIGSPHQGASAELTHINYWVQVPANFALVQHVLGWPDEALNLSREALRRGRQIKHPFTLTYALLNCALLHYYRREPEATRELVEVEIAMAEEHGFREPIASGQGLHGWVITELGEPEQGVAELEENIALVPGSLMMALSAMLAQAYMRAGRADRALGTLDEALARGERSGLHQDDSELLRLKAEAILMRGPSATAEAEVCLRRAIEVAREQSAKSWELRATMSLARLFRDTNRRDEACTMLTEIYGWFTEGFETADLKDAKALLDLNA